MEREARQSVPLLAALAALTLPFLPGIAWAQSAGSDAHSQGAAFGLSYAAPAQGTGADEQAAGSAARSSDGDRKLSLDAQDGATAGDRSAHPDEGESLEEINNKLNNPGADLAQLNFKLTWNQFQGDLPGSSSQDSLTLNFQPVFPFKLPDGGTFLIRPSFPLVWQPSFNPGSGGRRRGPQLLRRFSPFRGERDRRARPRPSSFIRGSDGGFDEQFGLGDSQLVAFYSRTSKEKGYMWGAGVTMQFPTHTDDSLGINQFQMGPAGFAGVFGKWGSAGLFPQHFWNIGGSDEGYTALTVLQPWYWFNVGKGYQVGGSPVMSYDWAADDSDEAWTVPVNLGVAKTVMIGKTPVKLKLEGIYYIVRPDAFGPHWGLQLTMTPVIPNPFERHVAKE